MINELFEIRKTLGWSQERLAQYLGFSVRTVSRWETGEYYPSQLAAGKIIQLQRDILSGKITLNSSQRVCSQNLGGFKGLLVSLYRKIVK